MQHGLSGQSIVNSKFTFKAEIATNLIIHVCHRFWSENFIHIEAVDDELGPSVIVSLLPETRKRTDSDVWLNPCL